MKRTTKRTGIILIVIAALCITCSISPTLGFQVPFNQRIWKHHPVKKIRYYMSESLVEKLNKEKPSVEETLDLLGDDFLGSHPGSTYLFYVLKPDVFIGLAMYSLDISFNEDGSFKSAGVSYSD